jgi:hypothetical protein
MRELERIDAVEVEAWMAFDRSCEQHTTTSTKTSNLDGVVGEETVTVRDEVGDPRWLATIQKCTELRSRLLGLDKPITVDLNVRSWRDIVIAAGGGGGGGDEEQ